MRASTLLAAIVILSVVSTSLGDVIHLKSGGKIEGEILEQNAKEVVVKTAFGTQTFARDRILRIEHKATKRDEYRKRLAGLRANDAEGHYQLGLWCRSQKLNAEATQAFLKAVQIDPEHEGAHKALGHVRYEGVWMSPGKKKVLEERRVADEYRAKGMVKYRGRWVKEEDLEKIKQGYVSWKDKETGKTRWIRPEDKAKLDKGLVQYEGKWYSKAEADALQKGLYKVEGKYVDAKAANAYHSNWDNAWELDSEHYHLVTNKDHDYALKALEKAEKAYASMKEFFGEEPDLHGDKLNIYMFKEQDEYNQFGQQNAPGDEGWRQSLFGGFYAADHPDTPAAVYSYYDEANKYDWTEYHLYHALAVQYLDEVLPNITTAWIRESIVAYFQYLAHYKWASLRDSWGRYIIGNRFLPFEEFTQLTALADDPAVGFYVGGNKPLHQAEGALLILYLTKAGPTEYQEKFQKFLEKMKKASLDAETFKKVFKMRDLEKDFREWVNNLE